MSEPAYFVLDRDYINFEPGSTYLKRSTVINARFIQNCLKALAVLLVFLVLLAIVLIHASFRDSLFRYSAQTADGLIESCELRNTRTGYARFVAYRFTVGELVYQDEARIPGDCTAYPAGSALSVRYITDNPQQSMPVPALFLEAKEYAGLLSWILPLNLIITLTIVIVFYRRWQALRRLRRRGVVLAGEVVRLEKIATRSNIIVKIEYRFTVPRKRVLTGKAEAMRNDFRRKDPAVIGTPVTILYADDNAYVML